ncbi:DUF4832 domain-containing protein [Nitrospira tepida]|uniref:DUF4832 domain-containing protein n=1 Tax=Nitrospira tepida TaxID=2973512 RepID=UPI00259CC403|nr:DUF4832 domain-containing protein [Nitrospira tepida]
MLSAAAGCVTDGERLRAASFEPSAPMVTVTPVEIDEVLYNPGMGFADFHFGFGHPPPADRYPRSTVAYFRWSWADLEPAEGHYAFDFVDRIIEQAKAKGERLAFRIVAEYEQGSPRWLLEKGVASIKETDGIFPDYNNPLFLEYHEKLIKAFGERYGASPEIDHVDIGSVGCWGEWNTACCLPEQRPQCQAFFPSEGNQLRITDWYFRYFPQVPLVSLHGGQLKYGAERGAGWRGDCFGDYGYFTPTWNHMEHAYAPVLRDPVIGEAWKRGPVQFEVCGVMQDWQDKGFDIDRILQQGLDWHLSVLNAKSAPVPEAWRSKVEQFLKKMGYRLVLREFSHQAEARAGGPLVLQSRWENVGVAPVYRPWPLAYRLRNESEQVMAQWTSGADLKRWLPGEPYLVEETPAIPPDVPAGVYHIDVAVLDEAGRLPLVDLAIAGRRADRWYPISRVMVRE